MKWTRYMMLGPVLLAQALSSCSLISVTLLSMLMLTWTGCKDYDADYQINAIVNSRVSLAFNISTNRNATRMSEAITQQPGKPYRGIQGLMLFPFATEGTIGTNEKPLPGMEYEMVQNDEVPTNYYDNHSVKIPDGTASFLCYAKAVPASPTGSVTGNSDFVNGVLTPTGLTAVPETQNISFSPEQIYTETETVNGVERPKVRSEASGIADYLTEIAGKIKEAGKDELFNEFINNGYLVAASSTNVPKLKAWVESELNAGSLTLSNTYDDDYPSVIKLPDGAAAVRWNSTSGKFEPQPVTTTEANINRLDRFIYPAELWYYANSRIRTSFVSQAENYGQSWDAVLAGYENINGVMGSSVHSVAIIDPLSYAVGCLQVGMVVNNPLMDADETLITLNSTADETLGTFPLTAVFVSGQHAQAFNFTPKDDNTEYIIYDREISGFTMGDATTSTPSKYTNTLTFQSQDGKSVRFALEFTNNSGQPFMGYNGIVFEGTKFYMVGSIKIPAEQTPDYKKRIFTKGYTTQGTATISSLKQAYTYLPDLMDPRLEIGIELVPTWVQSTTTNVPL